jgi:hypothetical protein
MASQKQAARQQSNGLDDQVAAYEQELADYLQERIRPGLNRGSIPLLARSIAKEIAHREHPSSESEEEPGAEGDDEQGADREEEVAAFEDEMHGLQANLGEDWIVRFSVQGEEAWLTAEKEDGSQHLEAPTADVLIEAVELLDEGAG